MILNNEQEKNRTEKDRDPRLVEDLEKKMYEKYDNAFKELAKGEANDKKDAGEQ